jgi:hypothetical protein
LAEDTYTKEKQLPTKSTTRSEGAAKGETWCKVPALAKTSADVGCFVSAWQGFCVHKTSFPDANSFDPEPTDWTIGDRIRTSHHFQSDFDFSMSKLHSPTERTQKKGPLLLHTALCCIQQQRLRRTTATAAAK